MKSPIKLYFPLFVVILLISTALYCPLPVYSADLNGKIEEQFPQGGLNSRKNYKSGKLNGLSEEFYPNGKISARAEYANDQLSGTYSAFYENGDPLFVKEYKNGLLEGEARE